MAEDFVMMQSDRVSAARSAELPAIASPGAAAGGPIAPAPGAVRQRAAAEARQHRAGGAERVTAHRLCLIHPLDPRGNKVGGIETHVRLMLANAPADWSVLLVGVDGRGDCELGTVTKLDLGGREIDFMPVLRYSDDQIHGAAKSLADSITMRFALGLLKYLVVLKRMLGNGPASIELQRFEFALIARFLAKPVVQVIHGEGSKDDKMDSLIRRHWYLHRLNERIAIALADRIICVNPNIKTRLEKQWPRAARRASLMPVSVDTRVFQPADYDLRDGVLRVVFAGRLDAFKDPPLMFRVLSHAHARLGGALEFHYIGTSEAERYGEFDQIRPFTIRHGFCRPSEVAAIMARCHCGILTSYFEGMPCYLLELLSVGRPIVAVRLPQYDLVVEQGVSGSMMERIADDEALVQGLSDRLMDIWSAIRQARIRPESVRRGILPYSVATQLSQHYARHAALGKVNAGRAGAAA